MMRTLEVELYIRDESGCPLGMNMKAFSATKESGIWSIQRVKPQKGEKRGEGATQIRAVIDWLYKNIN